MDTAHTHASKSPAVMYARVFGLVLTLVGIAGFFVSSNMDADPLIVFDVNLTHNIVHLATGVLGLVAGFMTLTLARTYALVLGVVYTLLGIAGVIAGNNFDPFGLFDQINIADSFLHLAIGVAGLAAYFASKADDKDRPGDRV